MFFTQTKFTELEGNRKEYRRKGTKIKRTCEKEENGFDKLIFFPETYTATLNAFVVGLFFESLLGKK